MTGFERELDTATLSDALDRLGIDGQALGIGPLVRGATLRGRAYTVRLVPATGRGGTVGDFIDALEPGCVVVLDNGGRLDVSVWGDLLTATAVARRLAGTVIHGVCRDVGDILAAGYPVFGRGTYMRTGKDRVVVAGTRELVSLGTASVAPGDLVIGDEDGVVVVPRGVEDRVLAAARDIREAEKRIREAVGAGGSLRSAREAADYHRLQRPPGPSRGRE